MGEVGLEDKPPRSQKRETPWEDFLLPFMKCDIRTYVLGLIPQIQRYILTARFSYLTLLSSM